MLKKLKNQWLTNTIAYLSENLRFVCMTASLLLGILIGALLIRNDLLREFTDTSQMLSDFISARTQNSFGVLFAHSFLSSSIYILIAYFLGLFLLGAVPSIVLPAVRGLGIGVVCGYLYATHGLQGVAFSFLIVLPCTFLQCIVFMLACKEAFVFSSCMFKHYFQESYHPLESDLLKKYSIRFAVLFLFTALISLPDSLLSNVFIGIFGF